jgi:hypothetical protein
LLANQTLERGNTRFVRLKQIGGSDVLIERACLKLVDPDPDQVTGDIVPLREPVQRLAAQILLLHLPFELDAVGSMLCHRPSSSESPAARSIVENHPVRPEGPTPNASHSEQRLLPTFLALFS